ncbi:hypothetical protein [Argonema antarcticum]|uniref:hypothetical protein n=1 Tax=Argonema antarcticum TaxID=2942763 RepID=UPI002010D860|nr:hypothetical protein [Argonema antarcticum]
MVPVLVWTMPNKDASPEDREEDANAALGGLVLGIPAVAWGAWLARGLYRQGKQEKYDRLNSTFYRLIKESDGQFTVLRFAMEAQLPGKEAKKYLDEKAKEFQANFDVTETGDISYRFHL